MAREKDWYEPFIDWWLRPMSDFVTMGLSEIGWNEYDNYRADQDKQIDDVISGLKAGNIKGNEALGTLSQIGAKVDPLTEKYIDNMISRENALSDQAYQTSMRDTSLTSAASQLESIGLSPSSVIQTGGASSGVSSSPASNVHTNMAMQRYAQNMSLAKSILGMTSQMASAGIYGNALGQAKKAANVITSAASHSALGALSRKPMSRYHGKESWEDLIGIGSDTSSVDPMSNWF